MTFAAVPVTGRLRAVVRAFAAAFLLAALLVGMPYALTACAAPLDLTHVPSWDELDAELSGAPSVFTLMRLLVLLGWALWLTILAQTTYEIVWCVARLPSAFHAGPAGQQLLSARSTITGALVVSIALGVLSLNRPSTALAAGSLSGRPLPVATASAAAGPSPQGAGTDRTDQSPGSADDTMVQAGDTLWGLADRHLGNPLRWNEIYDLNASLLQDDGGRLTDPNRIYPGWTLHLPTNAQQATVRQPAPAVTINQAQRGNSALPATPNIPPSPAPHPSSSPEAQTLGQQPADERETATAPGIHLPGAAGFLALSVVIGLGAAASARMLRRRRTYRPGAPTQPDESEPLRPEDSSLAAALRRTSRLASGPGTEANADVPIATRDGAQLGLLELLTSQDQNTLALDGPGAEDALRSLLVAAATSPEAAELILPDLLAARLAPALMHRRPWPGCVHTSDTEEAFNILEERLLARARAQRGGGSHPGQPAGQQIVVLALGDVEQHQLPRMSALLKSGRARRLAAVLLTSTPAPWAVTAMVEADGTATLNPPVGSAASTTARFFHLSTAAADTLLSLLPDGAGQVFSTSVGALVDEHGPGEGAEESEVGLWRVGIPEEPPEEIPANPAAEEVVESAISRPTPLPADTVVVAPPRISHVQDSADCATVRKEGKASDDSAKRPVHISLLGPLTVTVRGEVVTRGLIGFAGELLAYLAVHPAGMTKDAILEAIWPERPPQAGTQAFNTAKTSIRTALRNALGATSSVNAILTTGDLTRLNTELITTDLAEFFAASRTGAAAPDAASRLLAHRRVADLYTGELCAGAAYEWAEATREEARRRALDAFGAMAAAAAPDDPAAAIALLDEAIGLDRYNEQLHLRLAQLQAALGRLDAVRATSKRLASSLVELGEKPTPAVAKALQELLHPVSRPAYAGPRARSAHRAAGPLPGQAGRP
ncbi:LysM peptidoglycan-binding domain-containing protein [Kitasatospora sp. NPDC001175]|uniref:LysM peptidoglycan-binding domain-containing protein n=1 Tax=Kitasatospora sp. NPDC001175 TaxID=3157103 RepID=UPI003D01F2F1